VTAQSSRPDTRSQNSHMIMQDKNYLQAADLILKWIDERVSRRGV
jgi:hypothetical protein